MKYLGTRNEQYDPVVTQDISGKQDKATLEQDVAAKGFTKNTGTYSKPAGGIPKTDLSDSVQASLGKADTALQTAPVTSVNGKTGAVSLGAGDVGAISSAAGAVGTNNMADGVVTKAKLNGTALNTTFVGWGHDVCCGDMYIIILLYCAADVSVGYQARYASFRLERDAHAELPLADMYDGVAELHVLRDDRQVLPEHDVFSRSEEPPPQFSSRMELCEIARFEVAQPHQCHCECVAHGESRRG